MASKALILAAGEGTRMKSDRPKVAHEILGKSMVNWVVDAALAAGCDDVVVVTGHKAEVVEELIGTATRVRQEQRLGTGHAVMVARECVGDDAGSLLVLSGDTPLITAETLRGLISTRESTGAAVTLLTMVPQNPTGYGRIVRDEDGAVTAIVEEKDCDDRERAITECNTGIYCFDARLLFEHLGDLSTSNAQGEYYLTDMVGVFNSLGLGVTAMATARCSETLGVNSRVQLAEVTKFAQQRINERHMLEGVTMIDPSLVWIGPDVMIGRDTVLAPLTTITGRTAVGERCSIGPNSRIADSEIGSDVVIEESIVAGSRIDDEVSIGPRAYLRPETHMMRGSKAGTHVEIKKSTIGLGSKVPHLSYIGDTIMGTGTNIGAGTITCNYDGSKKSATVIGDGVFIGSDTMLIAPVTIGDKAVTAAGSAIAEDVPAGALAIERNEQYNVPGWNE